MSRPRRRSKLIPEGTWPIELIKSEVVASPSGASKTWVTYFRHNGFESKSFFHLNAEGIYPIIQNHAKVLGLVWEGDVREYLKQTNYADHHAIEGWEGYGRVKFNEKDPHRYTIRIADDAEALR